MDKKNVCEICDIVFIYKQHICKKNMCANCKKQMYRYKRKYDLLKYKGDKCEICGYNKSISALEFHHKKQSTKNFKISDMKDKNIITNIKEIKKCVLVCANCHRELHEKENTRLFKILKFLKNKS